MLGQVSPEDEGVSDALKFPESCFKELPIKVSRRSVAYFTLLFPLKVFEVI